MRERMLVLAKAYPIVSSKYQELICVAGVTESGELRRIYPILWERFWYGRGFSKKSWIEYEVLGRKADDRRPESVRIDPDSIRNQEPASFAEIHRMISPHISSAEEMESKGNSLCIIRPEISDFIREGRDTSRTDAMLPQQKLGGGPAVRIDVLPEKLSYVFKCNPSEPKPHTMMCEDWELGALYRQYLPDREKAFEKCREKFLGLLPQKREFYLMLGTHFKWKTPMVISVVYPKKGE